MAVEKSKERLEREIWKILFEKGSGMVNPTDLAKILREKGVKCSWKELTKALGHLEDERKISYGTAGSLWFSTEQARQGAR